MFTEVRLEKGKKFSFLGLELERTVADELEVHQASFVKNVLVKHGLDLTSKPIAAVTMALPDASDVAPSAGELRQIQGYAGEFNWLATRTRPDLSYWTSILASAATKHGAWCLQ